jgi:hypothetical protein
MTALYGSVRPQLGEDDWSVAASSGGTTTTGGTLTFFLQARNRAGRNLLSVGKTVTWTAGQQIVVTINESARQSGEDIFAYILSATATTPEQARQIAEWRAKNVNQITNRMLPATITLAATELLLLAPSVNNLASLPTTRVNGMVRQVGGADFYKWDSEAIEGVLQAGTGYWIQTPRATTFLASTTSEGGCDRAAQTNNLEVILPSPYSGDGSLSTPVRYWLINGLEEDGGSSLPIGTLIGLSVQLNEQPTVIFAEKVQIKVLGKVRRSTGILTNVPESGSVFSNSGDYIFALSEEIERGYAIAIEVSFVFNLAELVDVISEDSVISTYPFIRRQVGIFNPFGSFFGEAVTGGDKCRILPDALGFKRGSGVAQIKNYITPFLATETFFLGLVADTSGQKVCLSAALGGACVVRSEPLASEAVRATISTQSGEAEASNWSAPISLSQGEVLQVSLSFPSAIRANYPDVIAGMAAQFNCPQLRVYFRIGGVIYRRNQPIIISGQSVTFLIMDTLDTTVVSSLPSLPSSDFNFWNYNSITTSISSGTGTLSGQIEVAVAYFYPSPNIKLTAITHAGGLTEVSSFSQGGNGGFLYSQTTAESTWIINHGLGFFPQIQAFKNDGIQIEGRVEQVSINTTKISFIGPLSGYARLN